MAIIYCGSKDGAWLTVSDKVKAVIDLMGYEIRIGARGSWVELWMPGDVSNMSFDVLIDTAHGDEHQFRKYIMDRLDAWVDAGCPAVEERVEL